MSLGSTKLREAAVTTRRVVSRNRFPKAPPKRHPLLVLGAPLLRLIRTYPGKSAAGLLVGTLMVGIVGNAVMFQHGRHPAPLFGGPPPDARPGPGPGDAVPLPLPRPPDPAAPPAPAVPTPEELQAPVRPAPVPGAVKAVPSSPKRRPDGIAALLRGDPPLAAAPSKPPDPAVLQAQHALVRLGYDVKPDGLMGTATRQALEKFAGERHLTGMTATLDPKLLHALLQAAGKPQE